jgi:hypothetical protein
MDAPYRLKIKIGQNEFEAEGPPEAVQQQFEAFKEMVARIPSTPSQESAQLSQPSIEVKPPQLPPADAAANGKTLSKIMRVDGRSVSLTARPEGIREAILLILYGQKELRENDSVSGSEVMHGLARTGGFSVARVDRYLEALASDGEVIVIGEHRAKIPPDKCWIHPSCTNCRSVDRYCSLSLGRRNAMRSAKGPR